MDRALKDLREFRGELAHLRDEAGTLIDCHPSGGQICGIIEQSGIRATEHTLAWVEGRKNA